jgi:hypothetical protein
MIAQNIPNADKLVKEAPEDRPFKIWVESNPIGEGGPQWLWAHIDHRGYLNTYLLKQNNINGVEYHSHEAWHGFYAGKFHLDTAPFQNIKPEVYEVGDTVEVLGAARAIDDYEYKIDMIGKRFEIKAIQNYPSEVGYILNGWYFPSYAVRKVVDFAKTEPEPKPKPDEIIQLNGKKYKLIEE